MLLDSRAPVAPGQSDVLTPSRSDLQLRGQFVSQALLELGCRQQVHPTCRALHRLDDQTTAAFYRLTPKDEREAAFEVFLDVPV
ncbi:hypothetical protein [Nonomuraea sp. NPDC049684]|uniref:hypothetical protein n=1 Tax=Nonomuraea sp. NPDC049684 TaxID=3364356 RepID=UPI0037B3A3A4